MPGTATTAPQPEAASAVLAWDLPSGWSESRGGGMRLATLRPAATAVEVSVIVLSGQAGGELDNVNRWRGQLGLGPIDERTLAEVRQRVHAPAGEVSLFDFTGAPGKKQRMLAGQLGREGKTWFFKMVGDDAAVDATKPDFIELLRSLHAT